MNNAMRRVLTALVLLALAGSLAGCDALLEPSKKALSPEEKAHADLKYWAERQYKEESAISLEEQNEYNTMDVVSVNNATGESHEVMAQMILKGSGADSNLDSYSKVQLVEVRLPNGEVKTAVRTESKAKGVEFHFPE
ncbi:MAG: hypothetical protein CVT59_05630 [Actinobacteria bacterium HGW-Actinobacteria-1]|nr:MAG: hypothetical protein CVT59_05630 [Actinobacteria bacterium HGW-Actinobacteria-1]